MSVKRLDAKLDQKKIAKQHVALFSTSGDIPFLSELPLIGFCAESERDLRLFLTLRDGMSEMGLPVILFLWKGSGKVGSEEITVVREGDPHYGEMWRACDMVFCFSERAVNEALESMCVPLTMKGISGVTNYDPNREKGNAFTFDKLSPWLMFGAMVRACETYKFPFDWKHIAGSR